METLTIYLDVLEAILDTTKIFLVDVSNPIKPLVEALLQLILDLFASLKQTGGYAWYDVPNPAIDPNFNLHVGGFPSFVSRFKAGLNDPRDPNRPQPVAGIHQSGFVLIVADAESPMALLKLLKVLMRFFGKEFTSPSYPPPADFKVLPVGRTGDPVLSVARLFSEQPGSIAVEWSVPPISNPGDPGFSDLIQAMSQTFVPPKFLVEKSLINPATNLVDGDNPSNLSDSEKAGQVTRSVETEVRVRGKGELISRTLHLKDENGDPFVKFQRYYVIDSSVNSATFLLGQLGTFRFIDSDVEPERSYYYRVRAFSGDLALSGDQISFEAPKTDILDKEPYMVWPGTDVVMGRPSPIGTIFLPKYPARFDVIENLKRLFQVAFSLNFHLPLPSGAAFTVGGYPIDPTGPEEVGKGLLTELAGPLTSFEAIPLVGDSISSVASVSGAFEPDPATGELPKAPWNETEVRRNSARLANIVAGAMLSANSAQAFKDLMEQFPEGNPGLDGSSASSLSELVMELTKVQDPNISGQGAVQESGILYGKAFTNVLVRLNVSNAVEFCKSFTLVGSPPNWVQISLLRDVAPWSGQMLYELLAKMQTLLDAYNGVVAELKVFIDQLSQKIDTLEKFLLYLTSILDFVESLSLGYYILSVPSTSGTTQEWQQLIDNAGGVKPPSGPGGYTGGMAIAYVAPDVTSFSTALSLLF